MDAGNPTASVGKSLVVVLWCSEIERLVCLAPQVTHLKVYSLRVSLGALHVAGGDLCEFT